MSAVPCLPGCLRVRRSMPHCQAPHRNASLLVEGPPLWAYCMSLLRAKRLRGSEWGLALYLQVTSMKSPALAALGWWPPQTRVPTLGSSAGQSSSARSRPKAGTYRLSRQTVDPFRCHWYS